MDNTNTTKTTNSTGVMIERPTMNLRQRIITTFQKKVEHTISQGDVEYYDTTSIHTVVEQEWVDENGVSLGYRPIPIVREERRLR